MLAFTTTQTVELAGTVAAFLAAYMSDAYLTNVGLTTKGFVEANPLNRWLFSKIGFALTTFIEAVLVLFTGLFFSQYGVYKAMAFYGIVAAGEAVVAIRNWIKLKAVKASLK